jgi:hypothetical protein
MSKPDTAQATWPECPLGGQGNRVGTHYRDCYLPNADDASAERSDCARCPVPALWKTCLIAETHCHCRMDGVIAEIDFRQAIVNAKIAVERLKGKA